jgi:polygalacturonase
MLLLVLALTGCRPAESAPSQPPLAAPRAAAEAAPAADGWHRFDVRRFGAVADGVTKNTDAIRQAIDAAAEAGGGTVYFAPGDYLTGPIRLKDNLTLFIDAGATLRFSDAFDDYLPMVRSRWEGTEVMNFSPLLYADGVKNVAIEGRGTIDGQGKAWWDFFLELKAGKKRTGAWDTSSKWQQEFARQNPKLELPEDPDRLKMGFLRPPLLQFLNSENISIRGVSIVNSPFWTLNPVYCDNITVEGVTIYNPEDGPNTDGINPESCRNVRISNCHIDVGDDCITIKSGRDAEARRINRPAENYTISNCTMRRGHGGVVIGSEMSGGVRRIAITNSVFDGTDRGIRLKSTRGRGGVVEDVRVSNVVMRDIREQAIVLNLFYTDVPAEPLSERTPRFRNIHFSGITAHAEQAAKLLGLPEAPLENVSFSDVRITAKKGFVITDARDIELSSVRVDVEEGPAVSATRTERLQLFDVDASTPRAGTPVVALTDVKGAWVHGCFAPPATDVFLSVRGRASEAISVGNNAFFGVAAPVALEPGLDRRIVTGDASLRVTRQAH